MKLFKDYARVLPPNHRAAIEEACVVIVDMMLDDLNMLDSPDASIPSSYIAGFLPPKYMHRYTPVLLRRFFICVVTVAWKLAQPEPIPLSRVAEELAAYAIIQEAESVLEMKGEKADFGAFEDVLFEDMDFEFLFDPAYDGIEDPAFAPEFGIANLALDDWFKQFGARPSSYPAVHPYAEDDEETASHGDEDADTEDDDTEDDEFEDEDIEGDDR